MTSLGASALDDELTALAYTQSVRQARAQTLLMTFMLAIVAVSLWSWIDKPAAGDTVLLVAVAAFWLVFIVAMVVSPATFTTATWRSATRSLLDQPWREAAVRVLNTRGTKLCLTSGEYIQVTLLPPAAREVVVRAGRVWLVGPDTKGRLAVRVDGLLTAWPARRIPPLPATAALPTAQPIAEIWLGPLTATTQLVITAALAANAVLQMFSTALPERRWGAFVFWSVILVFWIARWVAIRRTRRLSPTGPWARAEATVSSWRVRWNGTATGTVALALPDGRRSTAHLKRAPLDLFANVRDEKTLWIAGNDVVGYPHYPILAFATFTP